MFRRGWRTAVMGASAAVVLAPSAWADGPDTSHRPFSWTGLYVGIHMGGAWSDVNWGNVSLTNEAVSNDGSGVIGGGQIGYNAQFGKLVLGIEAAISGAGLSDRADSLVPGVTFATSFDWIGTVTGRVGYAGDHWLAYAKGGWAVASMELTGNNPNLPDSFSLSETANGWTAGAGIEWKLARDMSLAVEYNFIDLGSFNASGVTAIGIPFTLSDVDTQVQSVTARLNVRFGQ